MPNAVIAGYARSPFHLAGKGDLARVRADDLAAQVIRGLIDKSGVKVEDVEDIILGCAFPEGEQGLNVARLIGLLADLPIKVGGMTVNRFCGSSMSSIQPMRAPTIVCEVVTCCRPESSSPMASCAALT